MTARERWRAHARDGLGLVGLWVLCCSPASEMSVGLVSIFEDGESSEERFAFEGAVRTLGAAVDLDGDGAEEILLEGEHDDDRGLLWMRGDGSVRRLWNGSWIDAAQWIPPTDQREGRVVMLVRPADGRPPTVVQLRCEDRDPLRCEDVAHLELEHTAVDFAVVDFDGDAVEDLLVAHDNTLMWHPGSLGTDDDLYWSPPMPLAPHIIDTDPLDEHDPLEVADLDADGNVDIVAARRSGGSRVFFGDGAGSWNESLLLESGSCESETIRVGLVDDDEFPDIVTRCGGLSVFLNQGDRSFVREEPGRQSLGAVIGELALGAFFADGLAVVTVNGSTGYTIQRATDGTWEVRSFRSAGSSVTRTVSIAVADVNGDGRDELVVVLAADSGGC